MNTTLASAELLDESSDNVSLTTSPDSRPRRSLRDRRAFRTAACLLAGLALTSGTLVTSGAPAEASYTVIVPNSGAAVCFAGSNSLAISAEAAPRGSGQWMSVKFGIFDQTIGQWTESGFTDPIYARAKGYYEPGGLATVIGAGNFAGVVNHSYQAYVQIWRWNGARWAADQWTLAGHKIDNSTVQTNIYGQVLSQLGGGTGNNCLIL